MTVLPPGTHKHHRNSMIQKIKNRNRTSVDSYFSTLIDVCRVEVVTMDNWRPYRHSVRQHLPNATIVIDRFNVVRMASQLLEIARRTLRQGYTQSEQIQMKNDRFLILRRAFNLYDTERQQLSRILERFPELSAAYQAKEEFFEISLDRAREEAENTYTEWRSGIPPEMVLSLGPL